MVVAEEGLAVEGMVKAKAGAGNGGARQWRG